MVYPATCGALKIKDTGPGDLCCFISMASSSAFHGGVFWFRLSLFAAEQCKHGSAKASTTRNILSLFFLLLRNEEENFETMTQNVYKGETPPRVNKTRRLCRVAQLLPD
jgi:hypothetical protein